MPKQKRIFSRWFLSRKKTEIQQRGPIFMLKSPHLTAGSNNGPTRNLMFSPPLASIQITPICTFFREIFTHLPETIPMLYKATIKRLPYREIRQAQHGKQKLNLW